MILLLNINSKKISNFSFPEIIYLFSDQVIRERFYLLTNNRNIKILRDTDDVKNQLMKRVQKNTKENTRYA